jgi:hypothetical protein
MSAEGERDPQWWPEPPGTAPGPVPGALASGGFRQRKPHGQSWPRYLRHRWFLWRDYTVHWWQRRRP